MKTIGVFEFRDECLEEIQALINNELKKRNVDANDVVAVAQPSGYAITRVYYRKDK